MKLDNWQTWLKIACVLIALIILLVGFLAGYFYGDKSCIEDPFIYGINKLNEMNNDEFICSCSSFSGIIDPFTFNKDGVIQEEKFNSEISFGINP